MVKDKIGKRFGMLTVLKKVQRVGSNTKYMCVCDCGKEVEKWSEALQVGAAYSCGCTPLPVSEGGKPTLEDRRNQEVLDMVGQRFGKLVVLNMIERRDTSYLRQENFYNCVCDCGNKIYRVPFRALKYQGKSSCGKCQVQLPDGKIDLEQKYTKPEHLRTLMPKQIDEVLLTKVFLSVANKGKRKSWNLSYDDWRLMAQEPCYYCGSPASNVYTFRYDEYGESKESEYSIFYQGMDRINNEVGYVTENIVPCCKTCNYMKRKMRVDNWVKHMKKVIGRIGDDFI